MKRLHFSRFKTCLSLAVIALSMRASGMGLTATARQRYPWNGMVDVDILVNAPAEGYLYTVLLAATDLGSGVNLPVHSVWREGTESDIGNPVTVPGSGAHRLVWNAADDLPEGFVTESANITASLIAMPNVYTVRFNKNAANATGTMADQAFTYDNASPLRTNAFTHTGYVFAGWATSSTGAKVYNDKQSVSNLTATAGAIVDLFAKWTGNTYSVKFNANTAGATGSMANESFTYGTAKALTANAFAKTGYTFAGWATSASGAKVYNDKESVSNLTATAGATVDLYAKWTGNTYSVKFNANTAGATGSMANESFTYGTAKALTANAFAKTGYTFAGWATSSTGEKVYNDKQSVSNLTATAGGTVNLYGLWMTNTYTVRFNKNASDATGTMANQGFTYDRASALRANAFTRTGYTFEGWALSASGAKVYNDKQSVSNLTATDGGTVNLYAVWTPTHGTGIQLWEGGPYWAETNIGAENPWDYGYYFWWGDTVGYKRENDAWVASDGSSSNFSFEESNTPTYGKDNTTLRNEGWIYFGELAPEHDAANVHWGDGWRMPTDEELCSLHKNCDWAWRTQNGVKGYVVRGRNNYSEASIFLPAAGCAFQASLGYHEWGYYWSSTPSGWIGSADNLQFESRSFSAGVYDARHHGMPVRPVR